MEQSAQPKKSPSSLSVEDFYCIYKKNTLAWTDPGLEEDRAAFTLAFSHASRELADDECDSVAAETLDELAQKKGMHASEMSSDIRCHYTLRRALIRAGAARAVSLNIHQATGARDSSHLTDVKYEGEGGIDVECNRANSAKELISRVQFESPVAEKMHTSSEMIAYAEAEVQKDRREQFSMTAEDRNWWMKQWDSWREYFLAGGGGTWPREAFEDLVDQLLRIAPSQDVGVWRVGEFWSSASPGTKVLMLSRGATEITSHARHADFIRWVGYSGPEKREIS